MVSVAEPGCEDRTYFYNLIDFAGNMSNTVIITRHTELAKAIKEAKQFALDRDWCGPGCGPHNAGIPPRIVRTVKFTDMHRVLVEGPLPLSPVERGRLAARKEHGDAKMPMSLELVFQKTAQEIVRLRPPKAAQKGKPHPKI